MKKEKVHKVSHQFNRWLIKTFGKDLIIKSDFKLPNGKIIQTEDVDEVELNRRLVGYKVIEKIEKYINRYCKEIKIVNCDDDLFAGSIILLIPHPTMGVTVKFIPQCTTIQNTFFLYPQHYKRLMEAFKEIKKECLIDNDYE